MVRLTKGMHTHGYSLIAGKAFVKGELVYQFSAQLVHPTPTYQSIQIGVNKHTLDIGLMSCMNHSCDPSTIIHTKYLTVVAARCIAAGEELTFFYPSTEWDMARPFACRCQAPRCLRFVTGAKHLTFEALKRYFINPHIRKMRRDLLCENERHPLPACS